MTFKQRLKIKGSVIDTNNQLNGVFPSFNLLNNEFSPGFRLINIFSSHFSFHLSNHKNKDSKAIYICKLNECIFHTLSDLKIVTMILDTSIKNQVATSIVYVHLYNNLVKKTIHYTVNVTITEAELFANRCGINQAVQIPGINYIIVITDSIHVAHYIFNSSIYLYQLQLIAISKELMEFFNKDS